MPQPTGRAYNPAGTITLDRNSPVPLYFQLAQYLEAQIRSGALDVGDRLENEVKMAEELGLSRPTVPRLSATSWTRGWCCAAGPTARSSPR